MPTRDHAPVRCTPVCLSAALLLCCAVAACDVDSGPPDDRVEDSEEPPAGPRVGMTNDLDKRTIGRADFDGNAEIDSIRTDPGWSNLIGCGGGVGRFEVWYDDTTDWYGSSADEYWHRNQSGVEESNDCEDYFASAIATGDFNADGYDDIVVGVPGDDGAATNAGSIQVFYGSSSGLTSSDDVVFHQDTTGVAGTSQVNGYWGELLAAGDFNCDGYDDVAVGAPQYDFGSVSSVGVVTILYGSSSGIVATGSQEWHQDVSGVPDTSEAYDECGAALAVGNFNGDSSGGNACEDLAIGCPGETLGSSSSAGGVIVLYGGSSGGLSSSGADFWHQDETGIVDSVGANEEFGTRLAVEDRDDDGYDDLLVAVLDGCVYGVDSHIIYGSGSSGLVASGNELLCVDPTQASIECGACVGGTCQCTCSNDTKCFDWMLDQLFSAATNFCASVGGVFACQYDC